MASDAGFVFKLALGGNDRADRGIAFCNRQRGSSGRSRVHRVAVIAADIVSPVPSRFPECKVPVAGMAAHTCQRLLAGRYCAPAETNRERICCGVTHMVWIGSVARRAGLATPRGRTGIAFCSVLGLHNACLVLVAAQAHLGIGLCERIGSRKREEKNSDN